MQANDTLIRDKKSAAEYDQRARETNWLGPDVLFGLSYEYAKPGDSLLDLGIGSGLSSILFHKADYIAQLLDDSGFVLLKSLEFMAFKCPAENRDIFFKAYIAEKARLFRS